MSSDILNSPQVSPLRPARSLKAGRITYWEKLDGCGAALAISRSVQRESGFVLVVTADNASAQRIERELNFFLDATTPILHFPDWETLPYDVFSPLSEIVSERLRTMAKIGGVRHGILLTPVTTLMQRIAPRSHVLANSFSLRPGMTFSIEETRQRLEGVGYLCVSQVLQHGEFAVRGSILDLFPMGSQIPYRIELFDEDIESIRTFDPESQRSLEKVAGIELFPAREFPFDEEAIKRFRRAFRSQFPDAPSNHALYQDISRGIPSGGLEYYLPLFVDQTESLFDYLPADSTVVLTDGWRQAAETFAGEVQTRYDLRRGYVDRPPLPPESLFLDFENLQQRLSRLTQIHVVTSNEAVPADAGRVEFACQPLPQVRLDASSKAPAAPLLDLMRQVGGHLLLVAETAGHREALLTTLGGYGIRPRVVADFSDFLGDSAGGPYLTVAPLDHGLLLADPPLAIVTESQLSGEKAQQRRRRKAAAGHKFDQVLKNLEELEIGAPVVHQDHGIGRFRGLITLNVGGMDGEFLMLEYANQDKLYVPVSALHLIGRYSGGSEEAAPLHKLGGEQWQKARRKAWERVRDVAAELLDIYAKRAAREGYAFSCRAEDYASFAATFPFEETPDQETAIRDVLNDLAAPKPMDRVVCGDVGFGKTEVAMRAAFVGVQDGKQVAVLVPTTLLAEQHFENFRDRFADWPIRIETLSRFVGKKQQEQTLVDVADGKVDILIGTHKLLQKDLRFKRLGLVIVDEEQRFGVAQKEHFKKLRAELDFLTLTATPIPRTLNLAMSGLRDISIIATPPPNRHAIKTFVSEWDGALIQEAMLREIRRGGQVYFLHNKIETMEKAARELQELVPLARIAIAHGQMPERELERVMFDFYRQRFNVLVCTTIIESGIDVPTANTIIIQRADMLGLAQLHQIRGRVGRSHHRAYAYMIVPPRALMTSDAVKRLEAIEATADLGAGFMLSSHDLEIRGAGELLGDEQSGQIQEVGLSLYTELLERAVAALKSGKTPSLDQLPHETGPEIDLQCPALIPDTYLGDVHARLVLYKRIANARDHDGLRDLQIEMIDRFGLLPPPTKNLFAITELKLRAAPLGIRKIEAGPTAGRILFHPDPNVDPAKVIALIQKQPQRYKLDGPDKLRFSGSFADPEVKAKFLEELLGQLV